MPDVIRIPFVIPAALAVIPTYAGRDGGIRKCI
jgi:hypothetical protein